MCRLHHGQIDSGDRAWPHSRAVASEQMPTLAQHSPVHLAGLFWSWPIWVHGTSPSAGSRGAGTRVGGRLPVSRETRLCGSGLGARLGQLPPEFAERQIWIVFALTPEEAQAGEDRCPSCLLLGTLLRSSARYLPRR